MPTNRPATHARACAHTCRRVYKQQREGGGGGGGHGRRRTHPDRREGEKVGQCAQERDTAGGGGGGCSALFSHTPTDAREKR
eukprot:COSAG02_NODE_470_length_21686_cov_5.095937_16_plen_82_part_00